MRMVLLAIAAATLLGGVAQANDNPSAMRHGKNLADRAPAEPVIKVLYVCDEDELSWRAFSRDLGTPEFVTADQVRAENGKAWTAPRCITATELRRLTSTKVGRLIDVNLTPAR